MKKKRADTQNLAKSCNEVVVMSLLKDGPMHGYELALRSDDSAGGYFRLRHGTLYPVLHKLEKQGLIKGEWSGDGPRGKRKRYTLTAKGFARLEEEKETWREFMDKFKEIIGEDR